MKLKYLPLFILPGILFTGSQWGCKSNEKEEGQTIISGEVADFEDGVITLYRVIAEDSSKIDTFEIKKGKFEFRFTDSEPRLANLVFPDGTSAVQFFTEPGNITMKGAKDNLNQMEITGTPTNVLNQEVKLINEGLETEFRELYEKANQAQTSGDLTALDSIEPQMQKFQARAAKANVEFAMEHPTSLLSAYLGLTASMTPDLDLKPLYNSLSEEIKATFFGQRLQTVVEASTKTAIGTSAPDFEGISPDGKIIKLSSLKGKHVLIDFWASWCMPCRQENPAVVSVYQAYKSKGFDIIGVSLDQEKDKWIEAIAQDNLTWPHVSDLMGWKSKIVAMYGVQGIPQNFLLDKDGVILAKSLRGQELETKLKEILN